MTRSLLALTIAVHLMACSGVEWGSPATERGGDSESELRQSRAAITEGALDAEDPAVAAIMLRAPDPQLLCTATLISPRVLLSAAHCLYGFGVGELSVYFGSDVSAPLNTSAVSAIVLHPSYQPVPLAEHDLAALILPTSVSSVALPLRRAPVQSLPSEATVRLVGFGMSAPAGEMGLKQAGRARLWDLTETRFRTSGDPSLTCFHDSGAPALVGPPDQQELAGVTISGDANCTEFSRFTRVDHYASSFVDPIVDAVEAGVPIPLPVTTSPPHAGCQMGERCSSASHGMPLAVLMLGCIAALARRATCRNCRASWRRRR